MGKECEGGDEREEVGAQSSRTTFYTVATPVDHFIPRQNTLHSFMSSAACCTL